MTARSEHEIKGNFLTHPFAELLAEIAAAKLNGSLRVSDKDRKAIVYFRDGRVVFAVSNARSSRLFDMLLERNKLNKEDLTTIPNFQNDFELATFLKKNHFLTDAEADKLFAEQIEKILIDALASSDAEWAFNHLARAREGLAFDVDVTKLLVDYGRCLAVDKMLTRFRSFDEKFRRAPLTEIEFQPTRDEAFIFSRVADEEMTASELISVGALSESAVLHAIYVLWLAGMLVRSDWQPAFSEEKIGAMQTAKLELKRQAKVPGVPEVTPAEEPQEKPVSDKEQITREPEIALSVEAYLERVENAETYYDILGVDSKADLAELKKAYFALARKFHPDRFHAEGGETLDRIQRAFGELAQAHETLKDGGTREVYDFRIRKELAEREAARKAGEDGGENSVESAKAAENFERGFTLLMDGEPEAAMAFLARAAHWAPKNARYRAYYGKALSSENEWRHKAEAEMQAAVRLDPDNPNYRLLLADFFINQNLTKRAEGELKRVLAVFPSNREAQELLATLKN